MRKLIASTFASLDGVMQAPVGPEENPADGFALGGWMFAHRGDESMDISASGFDARDREPGADVKRQAADLRWIQGQGGGPAGLLVAGLAGSRRAAVSAVPT